MTMKYAQLGLLAFLYMGSVYAEPVEYSAGVGMLAYHYKEFDDADVLLDREDGILPGVLLAIKSGTAQDSHEVSFQYHFNVIEYDGQTQAGTPARTDSRADIIDARYLLSRSFNSAQLKNSSAQFGVGFRYWRREIRSGFDINGGPVNGLLEHYYWPYLEAGLATEWKFSSGLVTGLTFSTRRMINGRIMIDYAGSVDDKTLKLGNRWGFRLAAPVTVSMENRKKLIIEPYFEYIDIGKSNIVDETSGGVPTGFVIWEPRSTTRNAGVMASIRW